MTININQFAQTPVRGQLDLQISKSGVLSGEISVNEGGSPKAGDAVILDSAAVGATPQFLLAGDSDIALGFLVYDVKKATFVPGDACEVAFFGGPVMYVVAGDTIAPGNFLDESSGSMVPHAAGKVRGRAIEPAVSGALFRMIIITNAEFAS